MVNLIEIALVFIDLFLLTFFSDVQEKIKNCKTIRKRSNEKALQ